MKSKKKEKKATSVRGNTYILTATGAKHLADTKGQGALIRDVIKKTALTAAEIVAKVGKALKSKTPARNVAFYLCIWKGDGFVKYGPKHKQ